MKLKSNMVFILNILLIILMLLTIIYSFTENIWGEYVWIQPIVIIIALLVLVFSIRMLKMSYKDFLSEHRWLASSKLNEKEKKIVEEAKELIKKVDASIEISNFKVYKVHFFDVGWFHYDNKTKEIAIFIPFKRFFKYGKDFCFMAVVHETLHSQNLRENNLVFRNDFLEGLNQLLTNWLIENYSEVYKIPDTICVASIELKNETIEVQNKYRVYYKEMKMVEKVLKNGKINLKELFIKYVNFKPEFFKKFVPVEYFLNL